MIRVVELFAGIGAQREALRRLGIPHEAYISEIDPYAIRSYTAIHGDTPNLGDVTQIRHLPDDVDLLTYSFPCQDLSIAGNRAGMAAGSGTRSALLWEVGRLIRDAVEREREARASCSWRTWTPSSTARTSASSTFGSAIWQTSVTCRRTRFLTPLISGSRRIGGGAS